MLAAGLLLGVSSKGEAVDYVDLELLLAVDVSASVDSSEYSLQMTGIAEAFRHPDVIAAMRASAPHGIAVALLQWAGPDEQTYTVPWSIVRDGIASETFAARVDAATRPLTSGGTAIGDALIVGISLLAENSLAAARRVIDVSGDGRANQGTAPAPVRAQAVSLGVTVNGLAILNEEPQLMVYYAERVIGGSGAFVMHADDYEDFGRAIRLKLIREIEGASVAEAEPGDGTDARSSALVRGTRAVATPIGFARHGR
jgi:hypothetical protein